MVSESVCIERWEEYFNREVAKRPELDRRLVEAIREQLVVKDKTSRRGWGNDGVHNEVMREEAMRCIAGASRTARERLRLMAYDELNAMAAGRRERSKSTSTAVEDDKELMATLDAEMDALAQECLAGAESSAVRSHEFENKPTGRPDRSGSALPTGCVKPPSRQASVIVRAGSEMGQCAASPRSTTEASRYPRLPLDLSGLTQEMLVSRLTTLASRFRDDKDYVAIRHEYVQVSFLLNELGLLAPVFRDQPRIPFKRADWGKFTQLLIDQIVIDLHWMWCRGERIKWRWAELERMFDLSVDFDGDAIASRVGAKNWSCDFRVEELATLSDRQQAQLLQLRSRALKKRFRELVEGERELGAGGRATRTKAAITPVRRAIANWAEVNHRVRGQEEMYEALWLAMELLGPDATKKQISELAALRCGVKPRDPKTVSDKLASLRAMLTKVGLSLRA